MLLTRDQNKGNLKSIGYLRISKETETLENQRFAIERFAKEEVLFFWDSEEVSGSVSMREREAWPELWGYIEEFKPDRLYVFELSRLGRDMEEGLSVIRELEEKVPVFSASPREQFLNQTDPMMRKFMMAIFFWFYEYEVETNRTRTKASLKERKNLLDTQGSYISKKSGKMVTRLGNIPWIYDRDQGTGELTVNQERLFLAKRAIKMWYNKGSYGEIAKKLGLKRSLVISIIERKDFYSKFP